MAHGILKPLSDEELKIRVGEFMNSFIALNKKNQASLKELSEYITSNRPLYHSQMSHRERAVNLT